MWFYLIIFILVHDHPAAIRDTYAPLLQRHLREEEITFISTPATTVLARLLPDAMLLRLQACSVDDTTAQVALHVRSTPVMAPCPLCTTPAQRIHSHYERTLPICPGHSIACAFSCVSASGFMAIAAAAAASSPNGCPPSLPPGRGARCGSLGASWLSAWPWEAQPECTSATSGTSW